MRDNWCRFALEGARVAVDPYVEAGEVRQGLHGVRRCSTRQLGHPSRIRVFRSRGLGLRFHSNVSYSKATRMLT